MQLALAYDSAHAGSDDWLEIIAWFRRAVEVLNHKEVAFKLDIAPSQLTDALNERDRKDIKGKWFATVLRMCNEPLRREYLEIVSRQHGYTIERVKVRTPEEELREVRELLKREAPGLLALVDREMGR